MHSLHALETPGLPRSGAAALGGCRARGLPRSGASAGLPAPGQQEALFAERATWPTSYTLTLPRLRDMQSEIAAECPPVGYRFPDGHPEPFHGCISHGPHHVAYEIRCRLEPGCRATLAKIAAYAAGAARLAAIRADFTARQGGENPAVGPSCPEPAPIRYM